MAMATTVAHKNMASERSILQQMKCWRRCCCGWCLCETLGLNLFRLIYSFLYIVYVCILSIWYRIWIVLSRIDNMLCAIRYAYTQPADTSSNSFIMWKARLVHRQTHRTKCIVFHQICAKSNTCRRLLWILIENTAFSDRMYLNWDRDWEIFYVTPIIGKIIHIFTKNTNRWLNLIAHFFLFTVLLNSTFDRFAASVTVIFDSNYYICFCCIFTSRS